MPDNLSAEDRARTMRAVKSKKTTPERKVRAMLASNGFRGWLVNPSDVVGNPDFAFPGRKVAIFVDGCFWHGCPICDRGLPETNREYWESKIRRNIERDLEHDVHLKEKGWRVVRIWEHNLRKDADLSALVDAIQQALGTSRHKVLAHGN